MFVNVSNGMPTQEKTDLVFTNEAIFCLINKIKAV